MEFIFTEQNKRFLHYAINTRRNIFLTGEAGTGKSAVIRYLKENTTKKILFLGPTGTSALNVDGMTIHSFFGLKINFSLFKIFALKGPVLDFIKSIDMIIIDEVSMVRADLLDIVNQILKRSLMNDSPFGGIQIVLVGDPFQLEPVVLKEDEEYLYSMYKSPYFFSSNAWQEGNFAFVNLKGSFRQKGDDTFKNILNNIRKGTFTDNDLKILNSRVVKGRIDTNEMIYLTTINKVVDKINTEALNKIPGNSFNYKAILTNPNIPDILLPVEKNIDLKIGARVMFIKNRLFNNVSNGSLGTVVDIGFGLPIVKTSEGINLEVSREEWEISKKRYDPDKKDLIIEDLGSVSQIPLKLAYATTIHKSQGQSYDKGFIDISNGVFGFGQLYVALSRIRTLDGLFLKQDIKKQDVMVDQRIIDFMNSLNEEI